MVELSATSQHLQGNKIQCEQSLRAMRKDSATTQLLLSATIFSIILTGIATQDNVSHNDSTLLRLV